MTEKKEANQRIYLKDYQKPDFLVTNMDLHFVIDDACTLVTSTVDYKRNDDVAKDAPLVLNGEKLELLSVVLDNTSLKPEQYTFEDDLLTIPNVPDEFTLKVGTRIYPADNKSYMGLYKSGTIHVTQCEAEGFRTITCFPDRPDILTPMRVTLNADKKKNPVLVAGGNVVSKEDMCDGRHQVVYEDPAPKPCYLFALAAGDFAVVKDSYTSTLSGEVKKLEIYCDEEDRNFTGRAMEFLKMAMHWDEKRFGLEYDLDVYRIIVTKHFVFGAMENRGCNVFNANAVLVNPKTITDRALLNIMRIIVHEYFHNYTGNLVTCRDWFQLSGKEGLTVRRDHDFLVDVFHPVVLIPFIENLMMVQWNDDAGPLAHSVRPHYYEDITNFYNATVYDKGCFILLSLEYLLGRELDRLGIRKYLFDNMGTAQIVESILSAMQEVSGLDLSQFMLWYEQAGTPEVTAKCYQGGNRLTLTMSQTCPDTPGQSDKKPMMIPVRVGFFSDMGKEIKVTAHGPGKIAWKEDTETIILTKQTESFEFTIKGFTKDNAPLVVPSYLRGFSAPVKLKTALTPSEYLLLFQYETDAYAKWNAGRQLMLNAILNRYWDNAENENDLDVLIEGMEYILHDREIHPLLLSSLLAFPALRDLMGFAGENIDPLALNRARSEVIKDVAHAIKGVLKQEYRLYKGLAGREFNAENVGRREVFGELLFLLCQGNDPAWWLQDARALDEEMTHKMQVSRACLNTGFDRTIKDVEMQWLRTDHEKDTLFTARWLTFQAVSDSYGTLDHIKHLADHEMDIETPNHVRGLLTVFAMNNPNFHTTGAYAYIVDMMLLIDKISPQVAQGIAKAFAVMPNLAYKFRQPMKEQVERALKAGVSKGVAENLNLILDEVNKK